MVAYLVYLHVELNNNNKLFEEAKREITTFVLNIWYMFQSWLTLDNHR